jgi:hypothetical protein
MAQRLNLQQILDDLNADWWVDNQQFTGGAVYQSATVYFQDTLGNWHSFTSTGACPENADYTVDPTTRTYYVQSLMRDCAAQLYNGQCAEGITNQKPRAFQPIPVYPH